MTAEHFLEKLPPPVAVRALKNAMNVGWLFENHRDKEICLQETDYIDLEQCITHLFNALVSPEGGSYWNNIIERYS